MLIVVLIIVVLILLLVLRLLRAVRGLASSGAGSGPPSNQGPAPTIPDTLAGSAIAEHLQARLVGTPADGSTPAGATPARIVWVDGGDEVLVHLTSTSTHIVGQTVLVSIDLECDQTGRTPLVVAFALSSSEAGGLVVATDEYPHGNGLLTSRWGPAVQAAAWSALLTLANDHAAERELAPRGLLVSGGQLHLIAGQPLTIG
ncbi:MAG: hypothetical protein ABSB69_11460 [Solirubrobacteraceae bacterium]